MTSLPFDFELAERNRILFLLDVKIAAARAELARVDGSSTDNERRSLSRHEARLLHANERLVLSALDARADAHAVRSDLGELAKFSQRDTLTNIPNRGLVLDRLETAIASARRHDRKLGVLFVDLDAFKQINDTLGHGSGDKALQVAARRLTAVVRESDTVGRFGGDEFLVILPDVDGAAEASLVAAKMLSAMLADVAGEATLSASIGIALYPQDGLSGVELVECADQAMYRAKARGHGHVELYGAWTAAPATAVPPRDIGLAPSAALPSTARWSPAHLADLREANEHLVLAVVAAQGLQTNAEDIHQRQGMFLAMVAHELRNPLNPIRTATELLQHALDNAGLLDQVRGVLRRQVGHLTRLVDDLLDGARASTGKFRLECSRVALRDILDPVIEAARHSMAERQQTFASWLPSETIMVYADSIRLTQVFSNLLDNASKYTQRGGEIGIDLDCSDGSATLRVSDNGIGISAKALPHIFDLFVQENHARAHAGEGLGLGLAIVRELVEAHGGMIVAASPGRGFGSEFIVTLPRLLDDSTDIAIELPRRVD
jgi:diguanylate cyclase (GGDEF)-like protein